MTNRKFVMVDEQVFRLFHRQWRAINRLWPFFGDEAHQEAIAELRNAAREDLRREIRRLYENGYVGSYLVPV